MRIPRYQFTSGTQMPQSRPVLRNQPTMRSPVTRNVNAYMSDPRAGQRDMNLEVAAAGRGKYVATALSKGLTDLGTLLARADAEEQYLNASAEFKIEIGANLSTMKTQKLSEPVDRIFNGNVEQHMQGAYTKSAATFNKWIIQRRDFLAKGLGREAKSAFLRSSVAVVANAQAQASGYARQQHIGWLKGRAWKLIEQAPDHSTLNELAQSDLYRVAMGDLEFEKALHNKRVAIDLDFWRSEISGSGLTSLRQLGQLARDNGKIPLGGKEEGVESASQHKVHPYGENLQGEHWQTIRGWVNDRRDQIIADREFKQKEFLNDKYVKVLANPNEFDLQTFKDWAAEHFIDDDGFNSLTQIWDNARNRTIVSSDVATKLDIAMNIENWTTKMIAAEQSITVADALAAMTKRLAWEKGTKNWLNKNHPVHGDLGWRAVQKLEREYNITVGGATTVLRTQNNIENEELFRAAYNKLEMDMMSDTIPDADKPSAAWDWVNKHIDERNQKDVSTKGSLDETMSILGLTSPSAKGTFKLWVKDHGDIKTVLQGPVSDARADAIKALNEMGIVVDEKLLNKLGIETDLTKVAEEKGSLDAAIEWLEGLMFWRDK